MVDAADIEKVEASRNELHNLLDKPQLQGIPVSTRMQEITRYTDDPLRLDTICFHDFHLL